MPAPTKNQRLRIDVGLDADDVGSLPDEIADDNYLRAEAYSSNAYVQDVYARVLTLEQLWAKAAHENDYVQNDSSEKASQRFAHFTKLLEGWRTRLALAESESTGIPYGALRGAKTARPSYPHDYPGGWRVRGDLSRGGWR